MQPCNIIYYSKVHWRLNMFWAAHRSSSGAPNGICSLVYIHMWWPAVVQADWELTPTQSGQRPVTTSVYKPEAADTIWSSWWWAVCRSKHVKPSINFGIINSITRLHLVGYFYWFHTLFGYYALHTIHQSQMTSVCSLRNAASYTVYHILYTTSLYEVVCW
jgi:hypothetical protein